MIKQRVKFAARKLLAWGHSVSNHSLSSLRGKAVILMYHRIVTGQELVHHYIQPGMYVLREVFEKHLQFLSKKFTIVSFRELLALWENSRYDKHARYCVITFDDGWRDTYTCAYPLLKEYGASATIFLPTALIGTDEWFWQDRLGHALYNYNQASLSPQSRLRLAEVINDYRTTVNLRGKSRNDAIDVMIEAFKKLPEQKLSKVIEQVNEVCNAELMGDRLFLNWSEVKEMSENGIFFGSHSCSHKILTQMSLEDAEREINDSLTALKMKNINYVPVFCYPNGNYNEQIVSLVRSAGYQAAVSTCGGIENKCTGNLLALKRIGIHNDIASTIPLFARRLSAT